MINCTDNPSSLTFLTKDEKAYLNNHKITITTGKGENIIKQNTFISNIIYVRRGILSIILEGEKNRNVCVGFAGDGDLLGIADLFSNHSHSYTAFSLKSSSIELYQAKEFRSVINSNVIFRDKILTQYSDYIRHLHLKLMVIGTKQVHGRLADSLLYLQQIKRKIPDIFNHILRRDIALLTGTSVENVIRLLKEFNHDGIIKTVGKEIFINNMELLLKLRKIG